MSATPHRSGRRAGPFVAALLLAGALASTGAHAQSPPPSAVEIERAKQLFKAGAVAFDAGRFDRAVQAFEQAHAILPRSALRFSAAQALRQWFTESRDPVLLQRAAEHYRAYLAEVPQGGRRKDAVEALGATEVLLSSLGPSPADPAAPDLPPAPDTPAATTIMVDSAVKTARVELDGDAAAPVPLFLDVEPGKHRVRVTAPGYRPYEREVELLRGRLTPVDAPLEELPAQLRIAADSGTDVVVDGRLVGTAPLAAALPLPSGPHRVVAGRGGHHVFVEDVQLERGAAHTVEVDLEMTGQRITAWVFVGAGTTAAVGGVIAALLAAKAQSDAQAIVDRRAEQQHALSFAEREDYNASVRQRDDLKRLAGGALGAGALLGVAGLLLYGLDAPQLFAVGAPPASDDGGDRPTDEPPVLMEVSGFVGPTGGGGWLIGRF